VALVVFLTALPPITGAAAVAAGLLLLPVKAVLPVVMAALEPINLLLSFMIQLLTQQVVVVVALSSDLLVQAARAV
jgi:hypothetical protein